MTSSVSSLHDFGDLRALNAARIETDVLIIGSGAGGSTVAATAAELGYAVLVLEEGPYVPGAQAPARMTDSLTKLWRGGGLTSAYGSPSISYAEGQCVGGSTEINASIFQRAPSILLTEWQKNYQIRGFGSLTLAPHYEWASQAVNAGSTHAPLGTSSDILAEAGAAMGWETKVLERGQHKCVETNMGELACLTGGKQSMSSTLIPKILRDGHRLIAEAKVKRIKMNGSWVKHVEADAKSADGKIHRLQIKARHVFLCAGAIQTPALLQNTGFRRSIGHSLRLHPTLKCLALFDKTINAQDRHPPLVAITEFMPDLQLGESTFTPSAFGLSIAEDWQRRASYLPYLRQAAIYHAMVRGKGSGKIYAMPNGATPIVTYKLDTIDWEGLRQGVSKLGQALLQVGASLVLPSMTGHTGWQSPEQARDDASKAVPRNKFKLMTFHLFGSCPMGENSEKCGVDSFGRVHGASNLYVADASLIPEAPGVNPQATVMALARRNALHILENDI